MEENVKQSIHHQPSLIKNHEHAQASKEYFDSESKGGDTPRFKNRESAIQNERFRAIIDNDHPNSDRNAEEN